ncbi:MAG: Gfo/Idh/MocA family oxidoreductase [Kiritimatiellae bacterium]|nr:Gfo/Idh/MocA family oxidoreductase [Kiritimatiellia bacterium]
MKRREFVKAGTAAFAAASVAPRMLKAGSRETVRMGFIGVGNRGTQLMHIFMKNPRVRVTALCDVYEPYLTRDDSAFDPKFLEWGLKGRLPVLRDKNGDFLPQEKTLLADIASGACKLYSDYRKLLADANVDAVCVATPDHWHAIITIAAIKAGKDVYCEKPLTATIAEGRAMVNAQKTSRQIVTVGLNRRGCVPYQMLKKEIDSGRFGTVRLGRAARTSNIFPNGLGKCPPCDPPKGFDWDAWLGPRAYRPYKYTTAPYFFRWHTDFSSQVGNWGVHYLDAMRWMMNESAPCAVTAVGGKYFTPESDSDIPDTMTCVFEFASGKMLEFNVFEGSFALPIARRELELSSGDAQIFASQSGWEAVPVRRREFNNDPVDKFKPFRYDHKEALLDDGSAESCTKNLIGDFIDRCLDRNPNVLCPLEEGHRSTCFAHLANIAYRLGKRLEWDGEAERFVNCDEANAYLHYRYRDGYALG